MAKEFLQMRRPTEAFAATQMQYYLRIANLKLDPRNDTSFLL